MIARTVRALALVALAIAVFACGTATPPPPQGPVESAELGIVITRLPAGFRLVVADGPALELARRDDSRLTIRAEEVGPKFTLLEMARRQEQAFLAAPDGEFLGSRELLAPLGPAYTARGRFTEDGARVEESYAFVLRPGARGVLTVRYRYPAGDDTRERIDDLLFVLGEMEQRVSQ